MEILSIQIYSDILNTRDERYLKFALLLLRSSMNTSLNIHVRENWILFVYWKLLRIALLCACIYRGWSWEGHLKCTWTYNCLACTKKTTHVLLLLLLEAQVLQKICYSKWRMFWRTFSSFQAFWDSPREVVIQLCLSCTWPW